MALVLHFFFFTPRQREEGDIFVLRLVFRVSQCWVQGLCLGDGYNLYIIIIFGDK